MSNSFNISVKPEIAAAVVKIDANKSVLDENKVILLDVQGTKITSILTAVGLNKTELDGIRGADLTSILTNIGVNTTAIGVCAGILDDILEDTAALPQNVRGTFTNGYLATTSATPVAVIDITGHGKLHMVSFKCDNASDTIRIYINIDGIASSIDYTGDADTHPVIPKLLCLPTINFQAISETDVRNKLFNLEFSTSLLINISRFAGTADNVRAEVYYSLDSF